MRLRVLLAAVVVFVTSMISITPLHAAPLDADMVARQAKEAQRKLNAGDVDGALATYSEMSDASLPPAAIYNHAVALYRKNEFESAAEQFRRVAVSDNVSLAAKARFNVGNCHYASAIAHVDSDEPDKKSAIEHLERAITHFRAALRLDAADSDARANIELAAKLLDQLRRKQEPQSQEQREDNPNQEQEDSGQEAEDEQQSKDGSDESSQENAAEEEAAKQQQSDQQEPSQQEPSQQEPSQQEPSQQEPSQQEPSQQEPSQQEPSQENSEQSESEQENGSPNRDENQDADTGDDSKGSESTEPSEREGNEDSESSPRQEPEDPASSPQRNEAGSTQEANAGDEQDHGSDRRPDMNQTNRQSQSDRSEDPGSEEAINEPDETAEQPDLPDGKLESNNQESVNADQENAAAGRSDSSSAMTQEEAGKLLQAIRDRDMIRRLRREAAKRKSYIPVERDW